MLKNSAGAENSFILNYYQANPDPSSRTSARCGGSREPDSIAALGYDAAKVLADSINRAGTTEGPKVRDAIAAANVKGVTGQLKMNADRNVIKPAVIEEIQFVNGDVKYAYKTTINPN